MQAELSDILHSHRIRVVLERYCRGIDRLDSELLSSVYWDDAHDNHGIYVGPARDFPAFIIANLRETWTSTTHMIGQSNIVVNGDRAAAETIFVAHHFRPDGAGIADDVAGGRYADVLELRNGEWRILDRTVVMDWVYTHAGLSSDGIDPTVFIVGERSTADFGYRAYEKIRT